MGTSPVACACVGADPGWATFRLEDAQHPPVSSAGLLLPLLAVADLVASGVQDFVVAGAAVHGVAAEAAVDRVVAGATLDDVIPAPALDEVVAGAPEESVVAEPTEV